MTGRTTAGSEAVVAYERWAWIELLGNDAHWHNKPLIHARRPIRRLTVRTRFPAVPGAVDGSCCQVRVPGRGMVIVDVE